MQPRVLGKKALITGAAVGAGTARACRQDVADAAGWPEIIIFAAGEMDGLSVLVKNAGMALVGSIEDLSLDAWRKSMSINADSVCFGCKYAIGTMRNSQPGSIVNISSIAGSIAGRNLAGSNASKAATWLPTKSAALHCARERIDIRCHSVHPAFVRTPLLTGMKTREIDDEAILKKLARQIALGRVGEPADVAYAVRYLACDESRCMTRSELKLDGGISAM